MDNQTITPNPLPRSTPFLPANPDPGQSTTANPGANPQPPQTPRGDTVYISAPTLQFPQRDVDQMVYTGFAKTAQFYSMPTAKYDPNRGPIQVSAPTGRQVGQEELAELRSEWAGTKILVSADAPGYRRRVLENPDMLYDGQVGHHYLYNPQQNGSTGVGKSNWPVHAPEKTPNVPSDGNAAQRSLVTLLSEDTILWHYEFGRDTGDDLTITKAAVGAEAFRVLKSYCGIVNKPMPVPRAYFFNSVAFYSLSNSINAQDVESNETADQTITIDYSPAFENFVTNGTDTSLGGIRQAMLAAIVMGMFKEATAIDLTTFTVSFANASLARQSLDRTAMRPSVQPLGFANPLTHSMTIFTSGFDTKPPEDNAMLPVADGWAWMDKLWMTAVQSPNSPSLLPDLLYFPVVKDTQGNVSVLLSQDLYQNQSQVTTGNTLPPGYQYATNEEVKAYRSQINGQYIAPAPDQFGQFPERHVLGPDGKPRYQILNDDHMFSKLPNGHWAFAMASFYQPANDLERIEYNDLGGPLEIPEWLTYQEAYVLGNMINLANTESPNRYEMSMRRRDDLGFKTNETGEKTARYCLKYDKRVVADALAFLQKQIAAANSENKTTVSLMPVWDTELSMQSAEELVNALNDTSRGWVEAVYKWSSKFKDNNIYTGLNTVAGTAAFVIGMGIGIPWLYKRVKWFRDIINGQIKEQARAQSEGLQDRHGDKNAQKKTLDQFTENLTLERTNAEHEVIGRTREVRKILTYFANKKRGKVKEQFGLLHGAGGTGKSELFNAIADSLRLGVYPDRTPVDPYILTAFTEVRVFNLKNAIAGATYENEAEGYIKQILAYQKEHPNVLVIMDEVRDIATAGATPTDDTSHLNRQFKTVERQSIMFTLATEDVPDFLTALNKNPGQWKRRLPPVLGNWEQGMLDLEPTYVAQVVSKIATSQAAEYLQTNNVDLSGFDQRLSEEVVIQANQRHTYGDPSRSINDLNDYLLELADQATQTQQTVRASHDGFLDYIETHATGEEAEVTRMIARGERAQLTHENFAETGLPKQTQARPQAEPPRTPTPQTNDPYSDVRSHIISLVGEAPAIDNVIRQLDAVKKYLPERAAQIQQDLLAASDHIALQAALADLEDAEREATQRLYEQNQANRASGNQPVSPRSPQVLPFPQPTPTPIPAPSFPLDPTISPEELLRSAPDLFPRAADMLDAGVPTEVAMELSLKDLGRNPMVDPAYQSLYLDFMAIKRVLDAPSNAAFRPIRNPMLKAVFMDSCQTIEAERSVGATGEIRLPSYADIFQRHAAAMTQNEAERRLWEKVAIALDASREQRREVERERDRERR